MNSMDINGPQSVFWLSEVYLALARETMEHLAGRPPKFLKGNKYKIKNEQILKVFICTH